MARMTWSDSGTRLYETGVDRGVLFVADSPGVPWNGLTSVTENVSGGVARPIYVDGEKVSNTSSREEFEATLTAFTYPDEFGVCDGTVAARSGLLLTKQKRQSFSFSYRTQIGSDQSPEFAYKIHIVYNALAAPSTHAYKTTGNSTDPINFSWNLTSLPNVADGYRRTAHVILDSRDLDPAVLSGLEDIIYGNSVAQSRLPGIPELLDFIDTDGVLTVTDNSDGTFTISAPMSWLSMIDSSTFQLTADTAVFVDANTYTLTST